MFKECLENFIISDGKDSKCVLCSATFGHQSTSKHLKKAEHINKITKLIGSKTNLSSLRDELSEVVCQKIVQNLITYRMKEPNLCECHCCEEVFVLPIIFQHIESAGHQARIKNNGSSEQVSLEKNFITYSTIKGVYFCNVCQNLVGRPAKLLKHVLSTAHLAAMIAKKELPIKRKVLGNSLDHNVNCKKKVKKSKAVAEVSTVTPRVTLKTHSHLFAIPKQLLTSTVKTQTAHEKSKIDFSKKFNATYEELLSLGFCEGEVISLDLNSSNLKTYVEYCILPGEKNIYNFNEVCWMELGLKLIFPHLSGLMCLPCRVQFPDESEILHKHLKEPDHLKNLTKLADFEHPANHFSDLNLAKFYMTKESNDWVYCFICNTTVKNENDRIVLHTETLKHASTSKSWRAKSDVVLQQYLPTLKNIWYNAQVYLCQICNFLYKNEIDFISHFEKSSHLENVKRFECDGAKFKFDFCHICAMYWIGKSDYYSRHLEDDCHKLCLKNYDSSAFKMKILLTYHLTAIDQKIEAFLKESDKAQLEKSKETLLLQVVDITIGFDFPISKAYIFGPRIALFGFEEDDVDIFLDLNKKCGEDITELTQKLKKENEIIAQQLFKDNSAEWLIMTDLEDVRGSVLKLKHIPTGLLCSIHFTNDLCVEKSKLIRRYNATFPICRKMILYLRKWLNICQLLEGSDRICITTSTICYLAIFYLQVKGILPSVYDFVNPKNEFLITKVSTSDSCLKLVYEFFKFYTDFDYKSFIVCPFLGKEVEKSMFAYHEELPPEMEIYKMNLDGTDAKILRIDSPMCVQDPVDLAQNVTQSVDKRQLSIIKKYCAESAKKIFARVQREKID